MSQILLTLNDNTKIEAFLSFVKDLQYIDAAKVLPENAPAHTEAEESNPSLPAPTKGDYRVEEIQAIADTLPKNYRWTAPDLQKYFPKDLLISVQIIKNQLFIVPSPTNFHQALSIEVTQAMPSFVKKNKLGKVRCAPLDVELNTNTVVQPDIMYIAITRYAIMQDIIKGAPDLVVEIWSPANKKKERDMKREEYEAYSVTEYWQIFPKKKKILIEVLNDAGKYEVYSEAKKTGEVHSKVLAGFSIDVAELWESVTA